MAIVTLTSDLGLKDYYIASVKGRLLSELPDVRIIDISHEITPFNLFEASFVLKNAYHNFPKGSIHITGVDSEQKKDGSRGNIKHIAFKYDGHYFIGTDNGIFSLMFDEEVSEIDYVELTFIEELATGTFPMRDIFAPAASHIIRGGTLPILGPERKGFYQSLTYKPTVDEFGINGAVIYIDSFGNLITNITRTLFERAREARAFDCKIRGESYGINQICHQYNDVENGTALAIFTTEGYLQIAINRGAPGTGGGAAGLFGLQMFSPIRIDFEKEADSIADL